MTRAQYWIDSWFPCTPGQASTSTRRSSVGCIFQTVRYASTFVHRKGLVRWSQKSRRHQRNEDCAPFSTRPPDEVEIVQPHRRNSRRLSYRLLDQDQPVIGRRRLAGTRSRLHLVVSDNGLPILVEQKTFCTSLETGLYSKVCYPYQPWMHASIRHVARWFMQ